MVWAQNASSCKLLYSSIKTPILAPSRNWYNAYLHVHSLETGHAQLTLHLSTFNGRISASLKRTAKKSKKKQKNKQETNKTKSKIKVTKTC